MHVATETKLTPEQVKDRFNNIRSSSETTTQEKIPGNSVNLSYDPKRTPPKFFLAGAPVTLPAAAEVAINDKTEGAEVVLRLMWGPLPAPFPRALAACGVLLCVLLMAFFSTVQPLWVIATLSAVLPVAALIYQMRGEKRLQTRLSELLDGVTFTPRAH